MVPAMTMGDGMQPAQVYMQPAMGFHPCGSELQHSESAGHTHTAQESHDCGMPPSENDQQASSPTPNKTCSDFASGDTVKQAPNPKQSARKSNKAAKAQKRAALAKNESSSGSSGSSRGTETSGATDGDDLGEDHCNELIFQLVSHAESQKALGLESSLAKCSAFTLILPLTRTLAFTKHGCRVIQKAIEVGDSRDHSLLVEQLAGHITALYRSPNGNHVAQQMIISMPPAKLEFLLAELKGTMTTVAKHQFGCRLPERMLEHCPPAQIESLIDELLVNAKPFCCHPYGNFAMQHIFEYGSPSMKAKIIEQVVDDLPHLSKHRIASHVVQKALGFCAEDLQQILVSAFMRGQGDDSLVALACTRYGSYVIASLANVQAYRRDVCQLLQDGLSQVSRDQYGARVVAKFGLSTLPLP